VIKKKKKRRESNDDDDTNNPNVEIEYVQEDIPVKRGDGYYSHFVKVFENFKLESKRMMMVLKYIMINMVEKFLDLKLFYHVIKQILMKMKKKMMMKKKHLIMIKRKKMQMMMNQKKYLKNN